MQELSPIQARVLGSLIEKKETTPDQYPLTLNALRNACNQKTSRNPVTRFSEGEIGRAVRELEAMGLVREHWGARVPKYEHRAGKVLELYSKGVAVICALMLRGPQTPGELKSNTQRLYDFEDREDVQFTLDDLQKKEPPLVTALPRQPGQKEGRYAHLLCGEPQLPEPAAPADRAAHPGGPEGQLAELERQVAELRRRIEALEEKTGDGE